MIQRQQKKNTVPNGDMLQKYKTIKIITPKGKVAAFTYSQQTSLSIQE
jgi:hypothetical protein